MKVKTIILAWALAGSFFASPAQPGEFEDGTTAYAKANYAHALKSFKLAAEGGSALAQPRLGDMYEKGQGTDFDYAEALKWYRMASDQGDLHSQFRIGAMHSLGRGVPKNDAEAMKRFFSAAEKGSAESQLNLGARYGAGADAPKDDVQSYMWLEIAAASYAAAGDKAGLRLVNLMRDTKSEILTFVQILRSKSMAAKWMPSQDYYDKTNIDFSKGERWFCSENEARSAGWRKSKV